MSANAVLAPDSAPRRAGRALSLAFVAVLASLCAAWLLTHGFGPRAWVLALGVPVALVLLREPENGIVLGALLVVVVPYWLTLGLPQANVARLACVLALATLLVSRLRGIAGRGGFTTIDLIVVGVATAAFLSWLATEHAPNSLAATLNAFLPLAFYPAARVLDERGRLKLLWGLAAGGAFASLSLFYELLVTHAPLFVNRDSYYWSAKGDLIFRPAGTLGSPPGAVAVLAMTAFAGVAVRRHVDGSRRLVASAFIVLSVAGACITFTRAGLIGLAVGAVLYVALAKPGALLRWSYAFCGIGVVVALLVLPRVENALWYQSGVLRKGDFAIRQSYWKDAWPVIFNSRAHAVVGHGINSLLVGTTIPGTPSPDIAANPTLSRFSPHNQYVRTLVEQGLVGLGLLVAWLGIAVVAGARVARRAGSARVTLAALVGAGASFIVVSSANDSLRHIPSVAVIAAITGLIVSLRREVEHG